MGTSSPAIDWSDLLRLHAVEQRHFILRPAWRNSHQSDCAARATASASRPAPDADQAPPRAERRLAGVASSPRFRARSRLMGGAGPARKGQTPASPHSLSPGSGHRHFCPLAGQSHEVKRRWPPRCGTLGPAAYAGSQARYGHDGAGKRLRARSRAGAAPLEPASPGLAMETDGRKLPQHEKLTVYLDRAFRKRGWWRRSWRTATRCSSSPRAEAVGR